MHWKTSPAALLAGMPGTGTAHQALPVHVPARSREAGAEAATLTSAEADDRVAEIVRQCLRAHGGAFDPSHISHRTLGLGPADERMYSRLNRLLLPGELRPFVERHPEFSWQANGPRGMLITWATPAAPSEAAAPGSASAQEVPLPLPLRALEVPGSASYSGLPLRALEGEAGALGPPAEH